MRLVLALALVAVSCAPTYRAFYDVRVESAERPQEAIERFGEHSLTQMGEGAEATQVFEDSAVRIVWSYVDNHTQYELKNKTEDVITILWEHARFVDTWGEIFYVMPTGVTFKAGSPAPPVEVKGGRRVSGSFFPINKPRPGYLPGTPQLYLNEHDSQEELKKGAAEYVGKAMKLTLPLHVDGLFTEYVFTFRIRGYEIR